MKNYVQAGENLAITAAANVTAGKVVVVGTNLFGVANSTVTSGDLVTIVTSGVFDLTKVSGSSTSIAAGALVYWDATNGVVTTSATSNTKIGCAVALAANADVLCRVLMPARA